MQKKKRPRNALAFGVIKSHRQTSLGTHHAVLGGTEWRMSLLKTAFATNFEPAKQTLAVPVPQASGLWFHQFWSLKENSHQKWAAIALCIRIPFSFSFPTPWPGMPDATDCTNSEVAKTANKIQTTVLPLDREVKCVLPPDYPELHPNSYVRRTPQIMKLLMYSNIQLCFF